MLKKTLPIMLLASALTLSPLVGTNGWADTGKVQATRNSKNEIVYIVPERDARDTLAMIEAYARTVEIQRKYLASITEQLEALSADISEVTRAQKAEREAWQKKTDELSARVKRYKRPWALGAFAGWDAARNEAVVGAGVVFSILRF